MSVEGQQGRRMADSTYMTDTSANETYTPGNDAARFSAFTSPNPADLQTPRHRLSFSGFHQNIEDIVSIEAVEDVSDGRRSSMFVRVRSRHSERLRKGGIAGSGSRQGRSKSRAGGQRMAPLGKLFEGNGADDGGFARQQPKASNSSMCDIQVLTDGDEDAQGHGGSESDARSAEEIENMHPNMPEGLTEADNNAQGHRGEIQLMTPKPAELDYEIQIDDKELVHFCGMVLNLLRKELDASPGQSEAYQVETLPKLREAFNNLVACSHVPSWLSQKAKEMKRDLENQVRANGGIAQESLEVIREEFHKSTEEAVQQARASTEAEWRQKVDQTRMSVAQLKDQEAANERAGMVEFVKNCVSAIGVLKDKIEDNKAQMRLAHEEKLQAALQAKEEARREADQEWSRRVSMVRRETKQKTKEELAAEFKQVQQEELKRVADRVRAEAEAEWQRRLLDEKKNRRLSAQVKMTHAVEKASKRAEMEKEKALTALAEELEQEKEEATRNAAELARKKAEQEWKRKLSMGIKEAKDEIIQQLKLETHTHAAPPMGQVQHQQMQMQQMMKHQPLSSAQKRQSGPSGSMHLQREEHLWYENAQEVRRFSLVEGTNGVQEEQIYQERREVRGLSQEFAKRASDGFLVGEIEGFRHQQQQQQQFFSNQQQHQQQVSMLMRNSTGSKMVRNSTGTIAAGAGTHGTPVNFSQEFGLATPSPIQMVPMTLDETALTEGSQNTPGGHRFRASAPPLNAMVQGDGSRTPRGGNVPHRPSSRSSRSGRSSQNMSSNSNSGSDSSGSATKPRRMSRRSLSGSEKHRSSLRKRESEESPAERRKSTSSTRKTSPRSAATPAGKSASRRSTGGKGGDTAGSSSSRLPAEIPFEIVDLAVAPGELKGSSLSGKYREYNIAALVAVRQGGKVCELRTRKTMRYSAAREAFHDVLFREAERLGYQCSFATLFASFPPKAIGNSNSDATAKMRARAIQTYLLSVYDHAVRLIRISKTAQDKADIKRLLEVVFEDFMN